ncbi:Alkane 1-monooxygenase 2 [Thalassovita gelatinovora]|uniref:Alkane 1-monooxygenase 2 n=1 Tax=Thalassovita gelatinovora TaxID=53501 RepID=A0A0P1F909_THAGE|nr:alkane 1-monooxygenase [Thalassovita gelatinovora]QIZ81291.1 alkane 1-monooxygenase [Thalassovita gelatinovora]CUH64561.1 Alkane 1-monooxygenase 2 [Thalassovita gelatinovora]SEP96087.1 alkane 1-monooxygenase [Thalassovita gelatinovora]
MIPATKLRAFRNAAPFWLSLSLIPVAMFSAGMGGGWTILLPLWAWWLFTLLDAILGLNQENADPNTPDADLVWYRLITMIWFPIQFTTVYGMIFYATRADHLGLVEKLVLFFGVGVISGTVGIVYSHELMHQKNRLERWLGDLLLATVLYSHFRSEHLLVHHRHVGTPRDAVTARYNEGFHRYFVRVLRDCPKSAWAAERAMLERRKLPVLHGSNPFWRYGALQLAAVVLAVVVGGWEGLFLFAVQALSAVWQLELTNYVEHYGLTRKHLGGGKYEHVKPHHSWNAAHKATNWLLINLQRHSDHHYKPDRRFPLLQNYDAAEAPQLPYGYPLMALVAMIPPLWRRRMNPRVRDWRRKFYPEIEDWTPYKNGTLPLPRL